MKTLIMIGLLLTTSLVAGEMKNYNTQEEHSLFIQFAQRLCHEHVGWSIRRLDQNNKILISMMNKIVDNGSYQETLDGRNLFNELIYRRRPSFLEVQTKVFQEEIERFDKAQRKLIAIKPEWKLESEVDSDQKLIIQANKIIKDPNTQTNFDYVWSAMSDQWIYSIKKYYPDIFNTKSIKAEILKAEIPKSEEKPEGKKSTIHIKFDDGTEINKEETTEIQKVEKSEKIGKVDKKATDPKSSTVRINR